MNASSAPIVRPSVSSTRRPCGSSPSCIASAGRPFARVGLSRMRRVTPPGAGVVEEPHDRRGPVHRAARRHPQHGVLAQQRDERIHVGALPGVDVALEQLALVRGGGRGRECRELALDRPPRALERAVRGGDRGVEQLGDLGPGPAEHVAQDQHGALAAGQGLDRGQERELHPLALRVARRGIGHRRGGLLDARVGVRLHGRGPARAALELVQAGVGRDPVEPRLDRRAALEALEPAPGAEQRLLHDVLGVLGRAEHPVAVDLEDAAVRLDEPPERALVAGASGRDERPLVGCLDRAHTTLDGQPGANSSMKSQPCAPSNTSSTRTARSIR